MNSQALVPSFFISTQHSPLSIRLLIIGGGALLMGLLSQISIPLPFTPVPITGQTFGVLLVGLLWGGQLSFLTMSTYLGAGALGLPWFAGAHGGITGASSGYLVGMLVAGWLVGVLSDRGWGKTWSKALLAGLIGLVVIYAFGLLILSFFVPSSVVFQSGLYPFIPGALIKLMFASSLSVRFHSHCRPRN